MARIKKALLFAPLLALPLCWNLAQAAEGQLEEVIVTAEKRAQSIQDVPLSVAAISGDDVVVGKVTGLNDIAFETPGLTFNQFNVGEPRIYIRGIGNSSDSAASDPAVGVFLDEVYIGRTGGIGFDLFDLERIEILRGPQGTLYGKNTNGGAINIVTSRPSQERQTKFSLSLGNYNMKHVQALVNGGLSDTIAGKFVVSWKQRDGFGRNVITDGEIKTLGSLANSPIIGPSIGAAGSGDKLDDAENLSLRGQLLFDISERTTLLLGADYSKDQSNGSCRHLQHLDQAIQGLGAFWLLGMSEAYKEDDRNCATQFDTEQEREITGAMARLQSDFDWATLTSITAWRKSDYTLVDDLTGLPLNDLDAPSPPGLPFPLSLPGVFTTPENVIDGSDEEASQFSQEFRLTGTTGNFDWVAGAFYMKEDVERSEEFYTQYSTLLQFLGLAPIGDVLFTQDNTTTSKALYGQADWHFTDQWTFTYGLRWSDDKKEILQNAIDLLGTGFPTGVPLILPEFPAPVSASKSWSEVTNKFSLSYQPNDGLMFYATWAEGFKSGAFPSQTNTPTVAGLSVDPEIVTNREVGMKSTFWGNRAQFNVTYYDMDYDDLQVFELNSSLLLVLGSAQAESKGLDVEFNLLATDALRISTSYNYSDAKYTDFINASGVDVSGNDMIFAPDSAFAINADYTFELGDAGSLLFNVDYNWKDDYFTDARNFEKTRQEAVGFLGARAGWTSRDGAWMVTLWGKNLTDEQQIANQIVDPTAITSDMYMPPRTYGVTVTAVF
ncbi:MAG: TonB-dependent receptor [Lysobacterales bacterium]